MPTCTCPLALTHLTLLPYIHRTPLICRLHHHALWHAHKPQPQPTWGTSHPPHQVATPPQCRLLHSPHVIPTRTYFNPPLPHTHRRHLICRPPNHALWHAHKPAAANLGHLPPTSPGRHSTSVPPSSRTTRHTHMHLLTPITPSPIHTGRL